MREADDANDIMYLILHKKYLVRKREVKVQQAQ